MAFIIGAIKTVRRKVEFELPPSLGLPKGKADFIATFKVPSADTVKQRIKTQSQALADYASHLRKLQTEPDITLPESVDYDEQFLREDLETIEGLKDADGNDVPYCDEVLNEVLNDISARNALLKAHKEVANPEAAKRKN